MKITINTSVHAPLETVWAAWTEPDQIVRWNYASDDWCCPSAEINLEVGKTFNYRMEAKDGSVGFDFEGAFTSVRTNALIEYALDDDRKVSVVFTESGGVTSVVETFESENELAAEHT